MFCLYAGVVISQLRFSANCRKEIDMFAVKEIVEEILEQLPDDTTLEEVQYRLFVRQKIEQGLADVEAGKVVSHEEAKQRMQK